MNTPTKSQMADTAAWTRNHSDAHAGRAGCWFNVKKASHAVWWIERHCHLYEGEQAGERMILRGCAECDETHEVPATWDEAEEVYLRRAKKYARCVKAGHRLDWQYECTMRVFGWVTWSDHRKKWLRRFREASIWVSKKNKKSPTMAAWGMYLLIGDEEPGQKVFLGSKDGTQVRKNAAKHASEMVRQSPELAEECTVNKVECTITHEPSRSVMMPLSSSNERTTKSKEGLNGSMLVDETHVVDREFMNRVSRAGISRAEPLHAEFSTVGDDPDSYGKERFDLAEKVLRGEEVRQTLFAAIYAAPATVTDAELEENILEYGQMANPAMGHTVDPAELLADYRNSRSSPALLASFKMYRLNIWQNAASPWLSMDGWLKGKREFTEADFYGRTCWSALDLASVKDFASLTLCFPEGDDAFSFLWWFWLPEETARAVKHLIPIDSWLSDSRVQLTLTPGARIDYGYIRSAYRELAKRFDIQELTYDPWNAEQTTQELHEGVRDKDGEIVEAGTGIPRVAFSQSVKTFNEPTKRFEASVIDGLILHNGDPLATWMAGNATIRPDSNENYKPLKPKNGSVKKIDGIITAIMAHWQAVMGDSTTSVYQSRGFIEI